MATFANENDALLKTILNERFFKIWQEPARNPNFDPDTSMWQDTKLELFVTSSCNQKCEYCYLVKHQELYPKEINDPVAIKHNLTILYDWLIENEFFISEIEFFSGEIWHSQFGWDILDITLDAIRKGLKTLYILIPSNCSFCLDRNAMAKIQHYIDTFKQYDVDLGFSISIDGQIVEDESRPLNNKALVKNNEFYENVFLFAKHNNFYFHPMVSSSNVSKWIDNYKWWVEMFDKYSLDEKDIMMLEVRNNDWTEQSIQDYNNFMNYLIDRDITRADGMENWANSIFGAYDLKIRDGYVPYWINENINIPPCTIPLELVIRLGDLSLPPCHRTAYNKLLYGKFVVENDKIADIQAINVYTAMRILLGNNITNSFKCDNCPFNKYCLKGCFGAQWEVNQDPFMPIENVCWFFTEKWKNLVKKYYDVGLIDYLKNNFLPANPRYFMAKEVIDFSERVNQIYGLGKS